MDTFQINYKILTLVILSFALIGPEAVGAGRCRTVLTDAQHRLQETQRRTLGVDSEPIQAAVASGAPYILGRENSRIREMASGRWGLESRYHPDDFRDAYEEGVNRAWEAMSFGSYSTPEMRQAFRGEAEVPAMFIVTHQSRSLQPGTADLLRHSPRFRSMPRLFLASEDYRIRSEEFLSQASLVRYSRWGEFSDPINTSEIHLGGGYCRQCLAQTMRTAVERSLAYARRSSVRAIVHLSISYEEFGDAELPSLRETLRHHPRHDRGEYLDIIAARMLRDDEADIPNFRYTAVRRSPPAGVRGGTPPVEMEFVRDPDGKRVTIRFEDP